MTEESNVETQQGESGASAQPAQGVSQGSAVSMDELQALKKRLSDQEKEIRGLQSRQDKDRKELSEQREAIERYQAYIDKGKSPQEAIAQMERDEEAAERESIWLEVRDMLRSQRQGKPTGNGQAQSPETARIIEETGVDANDQKVIDIIASGKSGAELEAALLKHRISTLAPKQPSASSAPPMSSGALAPQSDEALQREYTQKLIELRGNRNAIYALKDEYRQKGVPVDSLVIT